jgi:hypothetical protein
MKSFLVEVTFENISHYSFEHSRTKISSCGEACQVKEPTINE